MATPFCTMCAELEFAEGVFSCEGLRPIFHARTEAGFPKQLGVYEIGEARQGQWSRSCSSPILQGSRGRDQPKPPGRWETIIGIYRGFAAELKLDI